MMEQKNGELESMAPKWMSQSFGDTLHDVLVRTIDEDRSPGLLALQFPTGVGKSYAVERTIATLVSTLPDGSPPILFVTPQKKNIPSVDTIAALCRERGYEPAPHDIMRLRSAPEMLAETVHDGLLDIVPREHRAKTNVDVLVDTVRYLRGRRGYAEAVGRILPEFKRSVRSILPSAGWEDLLALLEDDEEWRWLSELWPSAFTKRAKVLLMTSSKLFLPHDTLIEVPCPIDKANWIRGSIVFMDEFDSTKKDCLNAIVSNSTRSRTDLPGLVRSLRRGVDMSTLPESMLVGEHAERNLERLRQLGQVLEETACKTHVDYVYKADEGVVGTGGLFMYDGSRRGTSIGALYFVRTDDVRRENVIVSTSRNDDVCRKLASDVSKLRGAVAYAQRVISSMLRDRYGHAIGEMDGEVVRNETLSILEAFGVKDSGGQQLMLNGVSELLRGGGHYRGSFQEGRTLYEQGFGLVAVEESETHRFSSHIYAYAMDETPEKRLRSLIEKTLVIGLSATARVDSPLCNYDLDWLASQRPLLMRDIHEEDAKLLRDAFERHVDGYGNVDLRIESIAVSEYGDDGLYRESGQLAKNPTLQEKVANILAGTVRGDDKSSHYSALRYIRVAKAYRYFLENIPEGVFVCATSASPKRAMDAQSGYSVDILESLFRLVRRDMGAKDSEASVRFVEGSDDFQDKYEKMVGGLGEGCPRMFICASYESLATGVNLQYDGKGMRTVSVNKFSFDSRVDLVGVYLDRITNVAPTSHRINEDTHAEDTLKCAYELREMAWHGDISISEMDGVVRALMSGHPPRGIKLVDKPSVQAASTRMAAQMVGRMCRTSNKVPSIHVLFDSKLGERVDPYAMGNGLVGVETRALLSEVASLCCRDSEPKGTMERTIASRSVATAGWLADLSRRSHWSGDDMCSWEEIRLWCLRHPCPTYDELDGSGMDCFYVNTEQPVNAYRYWVRRDFEDVGVSFDMSEDDDYPLEVSDRAARLDVLARVPEVRKLFEREGWPLRWEAGGILMNPALFRNVYLGAIGEQVGKAVLESRIRGLALEPIEDPTKFEKFDFMIPGAGVYVDFKHWRSPDASGERYVDWIREKMRRIGATHVLVANLVCNDELRDKRCEEIEGGILSVPYLIDDERACISNEHVNYIRLWLRKAGSLA